MSDDGSNLEDLMNELQNTTERAEMSFSSDGAPMLDEQSSACKATNGGDVGHSEAPFENQTRFSEAESETDMHDGQDDEIFERFPANEEGEELHEIATSSFSDGYNVGEMLLAMSLESSFETTIPGVKYDIVQYVNLNKLELKTKKLFSVQPELTPVLFGYRTYFALLNTYDSRGYVARCPLAYTLTEEQKTGGMVSNCVEYVLMDILETRCWKERYDIAVFVPSQKNAQIVEDGLKWLRDNRLECRTDLSFDVEEVEK